MEQRERWHISSFEDVLIEKTDFKKVYTLLLRWNILPVHLEAFKDVSKVRSDKENNTILYKVIKSRGRHAYSTLKRALQLSNPELWDQFVGRPWKFSKEQWSCLPQAYDLSNAEVRGSYRIVTYTENRLGWETEVNNLQDTFHFLQYEGSVCRDPNEKMLDDLLSEFTESKRIAGCYVFALSGHGCWSQGEESILQPNKSYKKVNEIISKICKASSLLGDLETLETVPYTNTTVTTPVDIPDIQDTIILRPCLPGYVAYRDIVRGGWFIDVLTEMIRKYARMKDVEDIMIEASKQFIQMKDARTGFYDFSREWRYMTPCANTYSFKKFFFLPKEEILLQDTQKRQDGETSLVDSENLEEQ